ncbi:MAG: hypothetical protein ACE5PV_21090, partial [Candidatus Poribacteria bacterium]
MGKGAIEKRETFNPISTMSYKSKNAIDGTRFLRGLDYIAVLRPTLLLPVWTMVLLGYYHGLLNSGVPLKYLPLLPYIPTILNPNVEIWKTLFLYS